MRQGYGEMSKTLIVKGIKSCKDCLYLSSVMTQPISSNLFPFVWVPVCKARSDRQLIDADFKSIRCHDYKIPDWCPLPDEDTEEIHETMRVRLYSETD